MESSENLHQLSKKRIITIDVSTGTYDSFVNAITHLGSIRQSSYVCVANVHMVIEAYQSASFQNIVNSSDIVTPDGMPLAKAFQTLYNIDQERVDGMSLLPRLLEECIKSNLSVYFYGGSQDLLNQTRSYLKEEFSKLNIAGMYSPPFRNLSESENQKIINEINASKANLVFVVLGCPKQEKWMASMRGKISAVMVGVGGALPVMIGLQKRAPKWMRENSLEWFYRLAQEPSRLFKRYFITNSIFVVLFLREQLVIKNNSLREKLRVK
jgi:N-acetylglucosaminyldiphosphoundecaprenol N-acetyl-beta-D-mannosaminyltransferase